MPIDEQRLWTTLGELSERAAGFGRADIEIKHALNQINAKLDTMALDMRRVDALERYRDSQLALTLDERMRSLEGWRDGQRRWVWMGRMMFAAVIALAIAASWALDRYLQLRDLLKPPHA